MNDTPRWIEVRVLAPIGWCEFVAEQLAIGPCTSVAFGRPSLATEPAPDGFDFVRTFIPVHADSPRVRDDITVMLRSLPELTGVDDLHSLTLEFRPLPPEDYATSWKKSWKPFRVGRLCVLAPWSESKPRATDIVMHLEPGGAFGSGRHATTRMCMRVVLERIRGGERVLDAGSGSGILGVTAALCGAGSVLGFDVDPNAEPYATELAVNNAVANVCRFKSAGFEAVSGTEGKWDVVLANIYSDIIQTHATQLRDALAPRGWFAFSGCPSHHSDATRDAIRAAGLVIDEERIRGRWYTFVGHSGVQGER